MESECVKVEATALPGVASESEVCAPTIADATSTVKPLPDSLRNHYVRELKAGGERRGQAVLELARDFGLDDQLQPITAKQQPKEPTPQIAEPAPKADEPKEEASESRQVKRARERAAAKGDQPDSKPKKKSRTKKAADVFVYDPEVIDPEVIDPEVEGINKEFGVINLAGKVCILRRKASLLYPGQFEPEFMSVDAFRFMMRQRKKITQVKIFDEDGNNTGQTTPKKVSLADWWLRHPQVKQYNNGAAFMPTIDALETGDKDHLCLNLWPGFAVQSAPGNWEMFKGHIFYNLCGGNQVYYDYLIRWMAWVVQKRTRSEVCVVLRGKEEGSGKGFLAKHFGVLFGPAHWQVNNPEHVVGKFNPHLESLLLLNADEALFVGDPRHRNALWSLITEKTLTIERKNFTAYNAANHLNIIITTNAPHVVQVGPTARRVFVLDVVPNQLGNHEYFDAVENQLKAGGYEAMLHELQNMDLSAFNVRHFPKTDALAGQQRLSRKGIESLVEKACSEAVVPCPHYRFPGFSITAGEDQREGFDYLINSRVREFGMSALNAKRELVKNWGCVIGDAARKRDGETVLRGIQWPALVDLRKQFEKLYGPQDWLAPNATDWFAAGYSEPEPAAQGELPGTEEGASA